MKKLILPMLIVLGMMASCKKENENYNKMGFYTIECSECLADFKVNGETNSIIVFGIYSHTFINTYGIEGIELSITPINKNQNIRFSFGYSQNKVLQQSHTISNKSTYKLIDYVKVSR